MRSADFLTVLAIGGILGIVVGFGLGWTVNGVVRAHIDIRRVRQGMPGMRRHRWARIKATIKPLIWATLAVFVLWALFEGGQQTASHTTPAPHPSPTRTK